MKNKKGLTLVEVIVASALITLAVGGIIGVLIQNASTGQSIDYTYVATNLAKSRIERLREVRRDKGYTELATCQESNVSINRKGVPDSNGNFERTTTIDTTTHGPGLTGVTVTVSYKRGGTLMPVSVTLITLISQYYD